MGLKIILKIHLNLVGEEKEPVSDRNREIPSALSRISKSTHEGLLNSASESPAVGAPLSLEQGWLSCVA